MRAPRSACAIALLVAGGCAGRAGAGDVGAVDDALAVCAAGAVTRGIDVSHYDGIIDWAKVKASGIDFAFIKATENTNFVDPELATNWKGAGAAGVIRGAYHFLRPEVDAVAQADFFVATAGAPQPGDLPLALDLEVTDSLTGAQVVTAAQTFLARVQEKSGRVPVVYTSASFWTTIAGPATGFDSYALWVAHWTTSCPNVPTAWPDWRFWQNSATGTVPGITGSANVDVDQFNGSLAALQAYVDVDGGAGDGGGDGGDDGGSDGGMASAQHGGCAMADSGAPDGACIFVFFVVVIAALQRRGGGRRSFLARGR
jgi:GH25 family lysozyme M1 (1,4-beta-N-acetylmuramidase)